jgi:hypothetical protein
MENSEDSNNFLSKIGIKLHDKSYINWIRYAIYMFIFIYIIYIHYEDYMITKKNNDVSYKDIPDIYKNDEIFYNKLLALDDNTRDFYLTLLNKKNKTKKTKLSKNLKSNILNSTIIEFLISGSLVKSCSRIGNSALTGILTTII